MHCKTPSIKLLSNKNNCTCTGTQKKTIRHANAKYVISCDSLINQTIINALVKVFVCLFVNACLSEEQNKPGPLTNINASTQTPAVFSTYRGSSKVRCTMKRVMKHIIELSRNHKHTIQLIYIVHTISKILPCQKRESVSIGISDKKKKKS